MSFVFQTSFTYFFNIVIFILGTKSAKDSNLHITPTKISSIEYVSTSDTRNVNPDLKSLWVYRPASSVSIKLYTTKNINKKIFGFVDQ